LLKKKRSASTPEPPKKEPVSQVENQRRLRIVTYTLLVIVACLSAGNEFVELWKPEPIYPAKSLTKRKVLSDYMPALKSTRGDTEVLIYNSRTLGGTLLLLGGTHPNEPAANVAAVVMAENIQVDQGRVIIIHRANASAFTATEPQEAFPQTFTLMNRKGQPRRFQVGSRYSNMLDGWPDPIVYRHHPSGQLLSGPETRNLNRAYPGRRNGSLTEMVAYAITEVVKQEKVDFMIDLHEAAPEYPVINAIVAHQRTMDIAAMATVELQMRGIDIQLEVSPLNFHGLSHREVGDFTDAHVVLMETAGALQGRIRGPTHAGLVIRSWDPLYHKAFELGKLAVTFPEEGIPLEKRVGRHLESIKVFCETLSEFEPDKALSYSHVPSYDDLNKHSVGFYLK